MTRGRPRHLSGSACGSGITSAGRQCMLDAKAVAGRAGAEWVVEGEQARLDLGIVKPETGQAKLAEKIVVVRRRRHSSATARPVRQLKRRFERIGKAALDRRGQRTGPPPHRCRA